MREQYVLLIYHPISVPWLYCTPSLIGFPPPPQYPPLVYPPAFTLTYPAAAAPPLLHIVMVGVGLSGISGADTQGGGAAARISNHRALPAAARRPWRRDEPRRARAPGFSDTPGPSAPCRAQMQGPSAPPNSAGCVAHESPIRRQARQKALRRRPRGEGEGRRPVTAEPDDVRAEHAPHAGTDPMSPQEALGVHVAASERRLGALKGGCVSAARSLVQCRASLLHKQHKQVGELRA